MTKLERTSAGDGMRAAVYARFSCDGQRDVSIDDQLAAAERWAAERGVEIVARYCDYATSARTDDRPEFQRMLASMGGFDALIIWNTDRFARNMFDCFRHLGDLTDAGKQIWSVTQPELNEDGPVRMLLYGIYAWKDQRYSEELSRNVTRGMRGKAERCEYLGYRTFGYGHEGDRIVVDEGQARWVRHAYDRYVAGDSVLSIADEMAERGVRTVRGGRPSYSFVDTMLHNPKYKGTYVWKDVVVEHGMPAIVSEGTWQAAQERSSRRTRRDRDHDYFLSGRLVCATCGHHMHGESARGHGGTDHAYYACRGAHRACRGTVRMAELNETVMRATRGLFADYEACEAVVRDFMAVQSRVGRTDVGGMERELRRVRRRRRNLVDAIADGLPMGDAREALDELGAREAEILDGIERAREEERPVSEEELLEFLDAVRQGEFSDEDVLETFVSAVYLYPTRVVVVTNFADSASTLMEVEAALEQEKARAAAGGGSCNLGLVGQSGADTNLVWMSTGVALAVGF